MLQRPAGGQEQVNSYASRWFKIVKGGNFTFSSWFFFSRRLFVLLWFFLSWSFLFVGEDWIEWFNSLFLRFTFLWWGRLLIFVTRCGVNWIWFLKTIKYEVQRVYGLRIWGFMGRKSIVFNKANWFESFAAKILTSEVWAPYGRLIWGLKWSYYIWPYIWGYIWGQILIVGSIITAIIFSNGQEVMDRLPLNHVSIHAGNRF